MLLNTAHRFSGRNAAFPTHAFGFFTASLQRVLHPNALMSVKKGCPARARKGASGSTCVFYRGGLEVNFSSKLEDTRIEGRSNLSKVAGTQAVTDLIEFGMVPGVEGFEAELEAAAASLVQHEALEEGEVPVVATRAAQRVVSRIAKATDGRGGERRRAEPLAGSVGVADRSNLIGTVGRIGQGVGALSAC